MDKVVHSAVGLGMYLSALIATVLSIKIGLVLLVAIPIVATLKECIDYLRYGGFDKEDIKATINPMMVIHWYLKQIGK